jgi:phosphinothricin acetyltransferase
MNIRVARPSDAAEMLAIYQPFVENTSITFETITPTVDEFQERISHYLENYPWLVAEMNGVVAGYAYASRYRERTAYQWSVEVSVYINEEYKRSGLARSLYEELFRLLKKQGYYNAYAVINLPNDPSVAFHESMGFAWFATYEQVGYKLGRWKDVGWWRKVLNEFFDEPAPPLPFSN